MLTPRPHAISLLLRGHERTTWNAYHPQGRPLCASCTLRCLLALPMRSPRLYPLVGVPASQVLAHFIACAWSAVGRLNEDVYGESWIKTHNLLDSPWDDEYAVALYWALTTITTVGYGDISATTPTEELFCLFVICLGAGFYGYLVASIASHLASLNWHHVQMVEKMMVVRAYVRHQNFPPEIGRRIYVYFRHYYEQKSAVDEAQVLGLLQGTLRGRVSEFLIQETLESLPLFAPVQKSSKSISKLIELMMPMQLTEGEVLYSAGDASDDSLYVLKKGFLTQTTARGYAMRGLAPVCSLGEFVAIGVEKARPIEVRSVDWSEVLSIDGSDLLEEFEIFPAVITHIRKTVAKKHKLLMAEISHADDRGAMLERAHEPSFLSRFKHSIHAVRTSASLAGTVADSATAEAESPAGPAEPAELPPQPSKAASSPPPTSQWGPSLTLTGVTQSNVEAMMDAVLQQRFAQLEAKVLRMAEAQSQVLEMARRSVEDATNGDAGKTGGSGGVAL